MTQKARKKTFFALVCVAFLAVLVYEYLTPYLSDDVIYYDDVKKVSNFFGIFAQEFSQYFSHTGRSVAHIILRIFLYIGSKLLFDFVAAAVFVTVSLLIYLNVYNRNEYDVRLYGFILALLWFFDTAISNTVFWMDGACNYMFTGAIMLGFMTLFRLGITGKRKFGSLAAVLMLFYGVLAGWCNENTSGGVLLFLLIEMGYHFIKNGRKWTFVRPWMITSLIGNIIGLAFLVMAPGNYGRLAAAGEEHTGLLALAARFLRITNTIRENYLVLLCGGIVSIIIISYAVGKGAKLWEKVRPVILFIFLFFATAYALIMVPFSEPRSYYGAFLFLVIAVSNGFEEIILLKEKLVEIIATAIVVVAGILFVFNYFEDGANLARIRREFRERDEYCLAVEDKESAVTVPMLRPDWETRFSAAYEMDIQEEPTYWINYFYSIHYGIGPMYGVPREEWTEY